MSDMINGFYLISEKTSLGRRWVLTDTCILCENVNKIENESTETKMTCSLDWVPPTEIRHI